MLCKQQLLIYSATKNRVLEWLAGGYYLKTVEKE